jgi:hypothetical protein
MTSQRGLRLCWCSGHTHISSARSGKSGKFRVFFLQISPVACTKGCLVIPHMTSVIVSMAKVGMRNPLLNYYYYQNTTLRILLHYCYNTTLLILLHCQYTTVLLIVILHYSYNAALLIILHYCYNATSLILHYCYNAALLIPLLH